MYKLEMIQLIRDDRNSFGDQLITIQATYRHESFNGSYITKYFDVLNHEGNHQTMKDIVASVPKTIDRG